MVNQKGFGKTAHANPSKNTGGQGNSGSQLPGVKVGGVSNPRGIEPTKIGSGIALVQGPRQPKVGK